eukprot:TRINITY_DN35186_c1_g1_i1.p1 TRINITY_DN35186_c1_g1~~TRINITY_DN35186_c1_g1_i1.p1  ORF type:complete len:724 (-),score=111.70 TRINITY_DN35186_c1_g1_i1:236-2407(-)
MAYPPVVAPSFTSARGRQLHISASGGPPMRLAAPPPHQHGPQAWPAAPTAVVPPRTLASVANAMGQVGRRVSKGLPSSPPLSSRSTLSEARTCHPMAVAKVAAAGQAVASSNGIAPVHTASGGLIATMSHQKVGPASPILSPRSVQLSVQSAQPAAAKRLASPGAQRAPSSAGSVTMHPVPLGSRTSLPSGSILSGSTGCLSQAVSPAGSFVAGRSPVSAPSSTCIPVATASELRSPSSAAVPPAELRPVTTSAVAAQGLVPVMPVRLQSVPTSVLRAHSHRRVGSGGDIGCRTPPASAAAPTAIAPVPLQTPPQPTSPAGSAIFRARSAPGHLRAAAIRRPETESPPPFLVQTNGGDLQFMAATPDRGGVFAGPLVGALRPATLTPPTATSFPTSPPPTTPYNGMDSPSPTGLAGGGGQAYWVASPPSPAPSPVSPPLPPPPLPSPQRLVVQEAPMQARSAPNSFNAGPAPGRRSAPMAANGSSASFTNSPRTLLPPQKLLQMTRQRSHQQELAREQLYRQVRQTQMQLQQQQRPLQVPASWEQQPAQAPAPPFSSTLTRSFSPRGVSDTELMELNDQVPVERLNSVADDLLMTPNGMPDAALVHSARAWAAAALPVPPGNAAQPCAQPQPKPDSAKPSATRRQGLLEQYASMGNVRAHLRAAEVKQQQGVAPKGSSSHSAIVSREKRRTAPASNSYSQQGVAPTAARSQRLTKRLSSKLKL